jgi:hypothetical protein
VGQFSGLKRKKSTPGHSSRDNFLPSSHRHPLPNLTMNQLNKTPETIAELVDALADKGIDLRSPVAPPCPSIPVDADAFGKLFTIYFLKARFLTSHIGPSILQGPPMTAEEAERRGKLLLFSSEASLIPTNDSHAQSPHLGCHGKYPCGGKCPNARRDRGSRYVIYNIIVNHV